MLTVEEELEYLRNYLLIQRHRYDNFEVYYDVDAQALPCLDTPSANSAVGRKQFVSWTEKRQPSWMHLYFYTA